MSDHVVVKRELLDSLFQFAFSRIGMSGDGTFLDKNDMNAAEAFLTEPYPSPEMVPISEVKGLLEALERIEWYTDDKDAMTVAEQARSAFNEKFKVRNTHQPNEQHQ